jgi:hypothetical protein
MSTRKAAFAILAAAALQGCADPGPARERGFFGGMGAMMTGTDERQATKLENSAVSEQRRVLEARADAQAAAARQQQSERDLAAAKTRLDALDVDIARQRQALERLRAQRGAAGRAEADRLQRQSDELARRRAIAGRQPSAEELQALERLSNALDESLRRYGQN